jgi:hypothetical protein
MEWPMIYLYFHFKPTSQRVHGSIPNGLADGICVSIANEPAGDNVFNLKLTGWLRHDSILNGPADDILTSNSK